MRFKLALALFTLITSTAAAQTMTSEQKLGLAQQALDCSGTMQSMQQMLAGGMSGAQANNPVVTLMQQQQTQRDLMTIVGQNMAQTFTDGELNTMVQFYCSVEGRSASMKLPNVMNSAAPAVTAYIQNRLAGGKGLAQQPQQPSQQRPQAQQQQPASQPSSIFQ